MTKTSLFRVLGMKHSLPILKAMRSGPRRFSDLARELSASHRMTWVTLQELGTAKLVDKVTAGSKALYGLTPRGRDILKLSDLFEDFDEAHRAEQANPFWEMSPGQRENHRRFLEATK